MGLADNTERLVEKLSLKTRTETDQRILNDAFEEFDKSAPYTRTITLRNNKLKKYAGIAAILALTIIVWSVYAAFFNGKFDAPNKIYNDLIKSDNFIISMYHPDIENPFSQIAISKPLEMTLLKTNIQNSELLTLWDMYRNNKMTTGTIDDSIQTEKIAHNTMLDEIDESIFYAFSLNNFNNIDEIPVKARWIQIHVQDSDIFELSWQKQDSQGNLNYFKWRIILEKDTKILKRIELYTKSDSGDQYNLDSYGVISYPEQEEIKNLIRQDFDIVISSPEYQPTGDL